MLFYMCQQHMVPDYCAKYEYNQLILLGDITTNTQKVTISTQIWHRAKSYFTCLSNAQYLITVPCMNKITTFFPEISQQTLQIYEKIAIFRAVHLVIAIVPINFLYLWQQCSEIAI